MQNLTHAPVEMSKTPYESVETDHTAFTAMRFVDSPNLFSFSLHSQTQPHHSLVTNATMVVKPVHHCIGAHLRLAMPVESTTTTNHLPLRENETLTSHTLVLALPHSLQ